MHGHGSHMSKAGHSHLQHHHSDDDFSSFQGAGQLAGSETISGLTQLTHAPIAGSETISGLTQATFDEPVGPEEPSLFGDFTSFLGGAFGDNTALGHVFASDLTDVAEKLFNSIRNDFRYAVEERLGLHNPPATNPPGADNLVNVTLKLDDIQVKQMLDGNGETAEPDFKFDVDGQTWSYYKEGVNEHGDILPISHTFTLNNWDPNVNLIIRTYGTEVDPTIFGVDDPLPTVSTILTASDLYDHNFQTTARNADGSFDLAYDWTLYVTPVGGTSAAHEILA